MSSLHLALIFSYEKKRDGRVAKCEGLSSFGIVQKILTWLSDLDETVQNTLYYPFFDMKRNRVKFVDTTPGNALVYCSSPWLIQTNLFDISADIWSEAKISAKRCVKNSMKIFHSIAFRKVLFERQEWKDFLNVPWRLYYSEANVHGVQWHSCVSALEQVKQCRRLLGGYLEPPQYRLSLQALHDNSESETEDEYFVSPQLKKMALEHSRPNYRCSKHNKPSEDLKDFVRLHITAYENHSDNENH